MNAQVEKIDESEQVCTFTKQICNILDDKCEKEYFKKVIEINANT